MAVGVLGALIEILLLRRIYRSPELFQLLATFGVVLVVGQLVIVIWGPMELIGPRAPGLDGAVTILGRRIPEYELLLIVLGLMSFGRLTVRELPNIDPPIVSVQVRYPGASAAVVESPHATRSSQYCGVSITSRVRGCRSRYRS
jgi:hypothetical protein